MVKPLVEGWSTLSQRFGEVEIGVKQRVRSGRGLDLAVGWLFYCGSHHRETKASSKGCEPLGALFPAVRWLSEDGACWVWLLAAAVHEGWWRFVFYVSILIQICAP
ncbi:hypothetical protein L484_003640 [Morus notabilis]|uniref:Uncharacterized protein n=1 Tax=Morus notabilis TaxID=981085 RepID=W9RT60_9ROSA|nr:hypothetical protein L484_003640 [Morus notabilis]